MAPVQREKQEPTLQHGGLQWRRITMAIPGPNGCRGGVLALSSARDPVQIAIQYDCSHFKQRLRE